MGLFSFLDPRKSIARWAHKVFEEARKDDPEMPIWDVVEIALMVRYKAGRPKRVVMEVLLGLREHTYDIFSFCHMIASAELLSGISFADKIQSAAQGKSISGKTYAVIDQELIRLGHKPFPERVQAMLSLDSIDPKRAEELYRGDPEFCAAIKVKRARA